MTQGKLIARYPYRDPAGLALFEVVRYEPKRFEIISSAGNVVKGIPNHILYRLPELLKTKPGDTVYYVQGEKDVERLRDLGMTATTNPGGCRVGWKQNYADAFRGRHVVILPDADGPGRRLADAVARGLRGVAASVLIVTLPGCHGPDDVSDWLNRGGTPDQLNELIGAARYNTFGTGRPPRNDQQRRGSRSRIILESSTRPMTKLLLLAAYNLSSQEQRKNIVNVTVGELARLCGIHRVTAQRAIAKLRDQGVLVRRETGGHVIAWDILGRMRVER